MKTQNIVERKKLKFQFAVLYIVSILLLAMIFTALWDIFSFPKQMDSRDKPGGTSEEYEILKQDELLHASLNNLQQLDEKYTILIADSAGRQALDSLKQLIHNAEVSFSNTIDSIERQKRTFNISSNAVRLNSIISAFRSALNNRRSSSYIPGTLSGENVDFSTVKTKLLKLEIELQNKDNMILALEDKIKIQKTGTPNNFSNPLDIRLKKELKLLQADVKKQEERVFSLLALNNSLTKDNNRLTAQLNDLRSNTAVSTGQERTKGGKSDNLQNKIDGLEAELIFAKIDCNLSRADAKQIISNFRQRKDLLQESLNALRNLSHSKNVTIQKKAKEKLNLLQSVASTVRD